MKLGIPISIDRADTAIPNIPDMKYDKYAKAERIIKGIIESMYCC